MSPIFGSMKEVKCPNGPRFILKNPEQAFSFFFPEYKVLINGIIKELANVDIAVEKRVKSQVEGLSEDYAMLQSHYKVAYLTYCSNPCSDRAFEMLNKTNSDIRNRIFRLQEIRAGTYASSKAAENVEAIISFRKELRSTLNRSAQVYKEFRNTMPPSLKRTAKMTSVFMDMRDAAKKGEPQSSSETIKAYLNSDDAGERLIGIAIVESNPADTQYFDQVLRIIDGESKSAFEQYQAMRTIGKMLSNLLNSQKIQLQNALERQRNYNEEKHQWIGRGTDRWWLSGRLLSALEKSS